MTLTRKAPGDEGYQPHPEGPLDARGNPRPTYFNYHVECEPGGGVVFTGPISGTVKLSDGTVYNVTPDVIEHKAGHCGPILHHIAVMHELAGTLNVAPNPELPDDHPDRNGYVFKHVCDDGCGPERADSPAAS